ALPALAGGGGHRLALLGEAVPLPAIGTAAQPLRALEAAGLAGEDGADLVHGRTRRIDRTVIRPSRTGPPSARRPSPPPRSPPPAPARLGRRRSACRPDRTARGAAARTSGRRRG